MKVRNYMTTDVFTVRPEARLRIADEIMNWARIRHVPVVDGNRRLIGLVTHRDLLRASLATGTLTHPGAVRVECDEHLNGIRVDEVMCTDVATIDPEATVQAAARRLRRGRFGCLPVVSSRNELIGVLSEVDLLAILERIDLSQFEFEHSGATETSSPDHD